MKSGFTKQKKNKKKFFLQNHPFAAPLEAWCKWQSELFEHDEP